MAPAPSSSGGLWDVGVWQKDLVVKCVGPNSPLLEEIQREESVCTKLKGIHRLDSSCRSLFGGHHSAGWSLTNTESP